MLGGDCVYCPHREKGTHEDPCQECETSFEIFSILKDQAKQAEQLPNISNFEREGYEVISDEIEDGRKKLLELRSHKIRKKTEAEFDRKQLDSLGSNECIVICDFKMKILAMYHREYQKIFYGKRGTACLGFMVITPPDDKDERVNVHYYLFFSNDTTQDANFVLSAKAALYSEVIPTLFPEDNRTAIDAHFCADGAGALSCNAAKSVIPMWLDWTKSNNEATPVREKSYRNSVNGGGKTGLDGCFGIASNVLRTSVNNGMDIVDAQSCMDAYEKSSGIDGTVVAVF